VFQEPDKATDVGEIEKRPILPTGHVLSHWEDFDGQKSCLYYILGALDVEATRNKTEPAPALQQDLSEEERKAQAELRYENSYAHVGRVELDALVLSKLYQDTRDLSDRMKSSEALSSAKNERDRKYYRETFSALFERLGNSFKPPVTSEQEQVNDVDCLSLVKDLIPELTVANVERLAAILSKA